MSGDVCIVGVGIHPFGRTDGISGLDQGVFAVRQAMADAGVDWTDMQFAYGASDAAGNVFIELVTQPAPDVVGLEATQFHQQRP